MSLRYAMWLVVGVVAWAVGVVLALPGLLIASRLGRVDLDAFLRARAGDLARYRDKLREEIKR